MTKISDRILEEILQRCDIAEIISSYIPLKQAGRNFKALCPFHHEKTPSFVVSTDKQIFHCFGCGVGGDVFSFVMKQERLDFPEAVRFLAEKAGVVLEELTDKTGAPAPSVTGLLYRINELAAGYFQERLLSDRRAEQARAYLQKRGVSQETIEFFRIGYAVDLWDGVLRFLREKKIKDDLLLQSGLCVKNEQGRIYDRFRNRVIFPIVNVQGKIVGFGGRIIEPVDALNENGSGDFSPKYINSPETPVYSKSKNLYGLHLSRRHIEEKGFCVVVEGYLDFILPFQHGIKNLVASLGTAFTIDHIRILRRYTHDITIVFDPDPAGQEAALRSLDLLIEEGMNVKIATLESGFDPDTYVRRYGEEGLDKAINAAQSVFDYKLQLLNLRLREDIPEEKARIAAEMLKTIVRIKNAVLRATYLRKLSGRLGVSEEALRTELKKINTPSHSSSQAAITGALRPHKVRSAAERMLLALIWEDTSLLKELKSQMHLAEFSDPIIRRIAQHLYETEDEAITPAVILQRLNDQEVNCFMSNLLLAETGTGNRKKSFNDCVRKIKKDGIQSRLAALQQEINILHNHDSKRLEELLHDYHYLKKEQRLYERGDKKE
ncbi:MAG: DNA primase [Candidatus Omnitrophica bacterium]|nr:DNA primase [Candidatus Omnitrophota bacterium]MBU4478539.1 DNA primase [Candidatus Omnitrophota bacterium]MCG2702864.1 DNA primase [Candidatus Omnitrophota bacterium]